MYILNTLQWSYIIFITGEETIFLEQNAIINMNEKPLFSEQYVVKLEIGVENMHQESNGIYQKRDTTLSNHC